MKKNQFAVTLWIAFVAIWSFVLCGSQVEMKPKPNTVKANAEVVKQRPVPVLISLQDLEDVILTTFNNYLNVTDTLTWIDSYQVSEVIQFPLSHIAPTYTCEVMGSKLEIEGIHLLDLDKWVEDNIVDPKTKKKATIGNCTEVTINNKKAWYREIIFEGRPIHYKFKVWYNKKCFPYIDPHIK